MNKKLLYPLLTFVIVLSLAALACDLSTLGISFGEPTTGPATETPTLAAPLPTETTTPTQAPAATQVATTGVVTMTVTLAPTNTPEPGNYPLAGQMYTSPQGNAYNAVWDQNGWLHQPSLPTGPQRVAHEVSFTIVPGNYVFNGVECQLFLDEARKGDGGTKSVGYGNGLKFTVATADGGEAWAHTTCRKSEAGGFSIEFRGP